MVFQRLFTLCQLHFCEHEDADVPITYLTSLACVASYMLRSSLGIEELRLRLGMMLLGVGSFDDWAVYADKLILSIWPR